MSDHVFPEQACYVNCNFCNTPLVGFYIPKIFHRSGTAADLLHVSLFCAKCPETYSWNLAATKFLSLRALSCCHKLVCNEVNVPGNNLLNVVTVRCGLCANLLSVDLEALLGKLPHQSFQNHNPGSLHPHMDCGSSSRCTRLSAMNSVDCVQQQTHPIQPTEKRRVPSAYNKFIKEEIRRLKAKDPDISHKEAFSTAAKNWAHFPEIHFGPSVKGSKQV